MFKEKGDVPQKNELKTADAGEKKSDLQTMERELSKVEVEALGEEKRKQLKDELYRRVAELNTFMKTDCSIEELRIVMRKRQDIAAKLQSLFTPDDMAKLVEEWGEPEEDSDDCFWT